MFLRYLRLKTVLMKHTCFPFQKLIKKRKKTLLGNVTLWTKEIDMMNIKVKRMVVPLWFVLEHPHRKEDMENNYLEEFIVLFQIKNCF